MATTDGELSAPSAQDDPAAVQADESQTAGDHAPMNDDVGSTGTPTDAGHAVSSPACDAQADAGSALVEPLVEQTREAQDAEAGSTLVEPIAETDDVVAADVSAKPTSDSQDDVCDAFAAPTFGTEAGASDTEAETGGDAEAGAAVAECPPEAAGSEGEATAALDSHAETTNSNEVADQPPTVTRGASGLPIDVGEAAAAAAAAAAAEAASDVLAKGGEADPDSSVQAATTVPAPSEPGVPLRLLGPLPLGAVEASDGEEDAAGKVNVSFDALHARLLRHLPGGGFAVREVRDGVGRTVPGGDLAIRAEHLEGLRSVRFSPDGLFAAFLCGPRRMGIMETLHPTREPIAVSIKWKTQEVEVLDFLWLPNLLPQEKAEYADLVVVTTVGLEIFRLNFELYTAKSIKAYPMAVRLCWTEPSSGMVLVCLGPRTLQPFDLTSKSQKLPRFDLVLARNQVIEAGDVAVMSLYGATYCIHADSMHGRVSLRNISNPMHGTPEHDIVIDVADKEFHGILRLTQVDNLLVVLCVDRFLAKPYDIRHRVDGLVPSLCGPCEIHRGGVRSGDVAALAALQWSSGSMAVDLTTGEVFRLQLDMGAVLQAFPVGGAQGLATTVRLLLRRSGCRELLVRALRGALAAKTRLDEWSQGFAVLNHSYRQTIEAVSLRTQGQTGRQSTVSLQDLEAAISSQSILSEKDMVAGVFHPHFLEAAGTPSGEQTTVHSPSAAAATTESWRIPLPEEPDTASTGGAGGAVRPPPSPPLLGVVITYLKSLLSLQILPHKILQCFVFDICMYFQQEHTLQQLLHYHVLLDSPELVQRLREVAVRRRSAWATQACLDMGLRVQEFTAVADMLLHTRQYLDVVPFLITQQEASFKVQRLLSAVDADLEARTEDPDLLDHILAEVRDWRREAALSADQLISPDLQGCERWMPELRPQELAVAA